MPAMSSSLCSYGIYVMSSFCSSDWSSGNLSWASSKDSSSGFTAVLPCGRNDLLFARRKGGSELIN